MPDPDGWMKDAVEHLGDDRASFEDSYIMKQIAEDIEVSLAGAEAAFKTAYDILEDAGLYDLCEKMGTEPEQVADMMGKDFDSSAKAVNSFSTVTLRAKKDEADEFKLISDSVRAWRDHGKSLINGLASKYFTAGLAEHVADMNETKKSAAMLLELLRDFDSEYRERKGEKNLVDFNDIEHYAIEILKHDDVAAECRDRYDYIFIDEYQDSNYLQENIIGRIERGNNVFMVGDIKQSIYRFRLAEPDIFRDKAIAFSDPEKDEGVKIDLNRNFRSKKPVIDAVNGFFSEIMGGYDENAALHLGLTEDGGIVDPVQMIMVDGSDNEEDDVMPELQEMKNTELEALAAVKVIRDTIGENIYDAKAEMIRPIEKKDIVILMRGVRNTAGIFSEILKLNDIEAFIDENSGYFDTLEILTFTDLLRVIDNSRQDIPLLSVLRSSIFGFSTNNLIEIRLAMKQGTFRDSLGHYGKNGSDEELKKKADETVEKLKEWKKDSIGMDLDVFLWKLMRETGYYAYVGALPGGRQRQANLRALVDKTAAFKEKSEGTIHALLRYIQAIGDNKIDMGQVKLVSENDDAVRIMTIHKSKGLEFPVVLTAGIGKRFNFDKPGKTGVLHKDLGFAMSLVDSEEHWRKRTLLENVITGRHRKEEMEEEIRILYVAMTRAMDRLILLGSFRDLDKKIEQYENGVPMEGCYADLIYPAAVKMNIDIRREDRVSLESCLKEKETHSSEVRKLISKHGLDAYMLNKDEEVEKEIDRRLSFVYPYAGEEKIKSKYSVSELNSGGYKDLSLKKPLFTISGHEYSGAEKGTIYHTVMEHLDFEKAAAGGEGYVREQLDRMVEKEILFTEEADVTDPEKIAAFFRSDLGARAAAAKNIHKESPFNMIHIKDGSEVMVQGIIDCWFEDEKGMVLLDYKTNYSSSGIEKKYKGQMEIYAEALEKITGRMPEDVFIYLFTEDLTVKMM